MLHTQEPYPIMLENRDEYTLKVLSQVSFLYEESFELFIVSGKPMKANKEGR